MDLPSRQSLERSSRSPSSVRLAAISTRSHRTVLRGRDETAGSLQAPSMRSLWRAFSHRDAWLAGEKDLQEGVQKSPPSRKTPHPVAFLHPSVFLAFCSRLS